MDARKIAVLVLAGLAGLGAFFIAMNSGDDEPVEIVRQVEKAGVRILVSDANLRRGDRLSAAALKWVEWPEEAVALSPQYLREGAVEPADLERAVARTSIVAGEPILEAKIVRAGSRGMMAAVLEAGKRAVTVRVTAETASGGFILPGDRVDLYYTEPDSLTGEIQFTMLLENVKVLAMDAMYDDQSATPYIAGGAATIELDPGDAEYFTTARAARGEITLALRSVFEPDVEIESKPRGRAVEVVRYGRS